MTRKRPHIPRPAEPPKADDLKLINGIGPAVEIRLHRVSIFTFVQLASVSPADIAAAVADLAGLSSERIIKLDWIGQARKLAAESTAAETQKNRNATAGAEQQQSANEQHPREQLVAHKSTESPQEAEASMKRLHEATFTVELLLDEENEVNNMHIVHMQSGDEESWAGWQESLLVGFLASHADLRIQRVEVTAPVTAEAKPSVQVAEEVASPKPVIQEAETDLSIATEVESLAQIAAEAEIPTPEVEEVEISASAVVGIEPPAPVSLTDSSAALLYVRKPQVVLSATHVPQNLVRSDQPYEVHFTLHLTDTATSPTSTLSYTASAYGWAVDQWTRRSMGVVRGTIKPKEEIIVSIRGASLPQGTYWLEAEALVSLPLALHENSTNQGLQATVKGHLFEIY
jgi:hypothetical protein